MKGHAAVIALLPALAGCAARSSLRDGVFRSEHTAYRLGPLGPGWQPHKSDADVAFYQPQLDAAIMVNAECPMANDAPLTVAVNTLLIGFTDKQTVSEQRVQLAGRDALQRRVNAKLDGAPLVVDVIVLKKNDCLYDLVYLSPPGTASRGTADFRRFVAGFDTVEPERMARQASGAR